MAIATTPEADIEREAERLLAAGEAKGIPIRLIGGMAIRLLAGSRLHPAFRREVQDLDFVVPRQRAVALEKLLVGGGYRPNQEFNALNAARRMLFDDVGHGRQVDVFVGRFEMCHRLPLVERIELRPGSLPAADVLMTKLQIVSLNEKDRRDIFALLHSHEIARGDEDAINLDRIVELTSHDWGLQRTFELNLGRLSEALPGLPLDAADRAVLGQRIEAISTAIDQAPKSRKWRLRARVGERVQWYEEPEEVDRG